MQHAGASLSKAAKAVYKQRVAKIKSKEPAQLAEACEPLDDEFMGPGGGAEALLKVVTGKEGRCVAIAAVALSSWVLPSTATETFAETRAPPANVHSRALMLLTSSTLNDSPSAFLSALVRLLDSADVAVATARLLRALIASLCSLPLESPLRVSAVVGCILGGSGASTLWDDISARGTVLARKSGLSWSGASVDPGSVAPEASRMAHGMALLDVLRCARSCVSDAASSGAGESSKAFSATFAHMLATVISSTLPPAGEGLFELEIRDCIVRHVPVPTNAAPPGGNQALLAVLSCAQGVAASILGSLVRSSTVPCSPEMAQCLADGLSCLFSRALGGLSRVCCDLADAGVGTTDNSPRDDAASVGTVAGERESSSGSRSDDSSTACLIRHPAAAVGSAILADASCDAVPVIAGIRTVASFTGSLVSETLQRSLLRAVDSLCSFLRLPYFGMDAHILELCTTLRTLLATSNDLRYLAISRGLLSHLATHIADPSVPVHVRAAAERSVMVALVRSSEVRGNTGYYAAALPDGLPSTFVRVPAALSALDNTASAEETDALLEKATDMGVPVSNEMRYQLTSPSSLALWKRLPRPRHVFDWVLVRPTPSTETMPSWLPTVVRDHLVAYPELRTAGGEAGLGLPPAPETKTAKASAPAPAPAVSKGSQPPGASNATAAPQLLHWRGLFAALMPVFSVPAPSAWNAPPPEPATATSKTSGGRGGSAVLDAANSPSRNHHKTVFSFIPSLLPLFSEWVDWESVAPGAALPSAVGLVSMPSLDDSHPAGDASAAAPSALGTVRMPARVGGKGSATVAFGAGANAGATSSSKHTRGDVDVVAARKPRWAVLLQALNVDRKPYATALCNSPATAAASRFASFIIWSAMQQPAADDGLSKTQGVGHSGAPATVIADMFVDTLWLSRLCRAGVDAAAMCSTLSRCCPGLPGSAGSGSSDAAHGRSSPRIVSRSVSGADALLYDHRIGSLSDSTACDSCELLVHVSIVISATVLRSRRAAEHVAAFGPLLTDSILAAAIPTPLLLAANPALAAHAPIGAFENSGCTPCSPTLAHLWKGEGDAFTQEEDVPTAPGVGSFLVRLWCVETLRSLALSDRVHRVSEVAPPVVPPLVGDTGAAADKGAKAAKAPQTQALPARDAAAGGGGKKGLAKPHKADAMVFDAASTLALVSVALRPIAPVAGPLLPGLDSETKTASAGERTAFLVARHTILIARLVSALFPPTGGGVPPPPMINPQLRGALCSLLAACLTPLQARDRLLAEQVSLAYELRACTALARADAAGPVAPAAGAVPTPVTGASPRIAPPIAAAGSGAHHHSGGPASSASGAQSGPGGEIRGAWSQAAKALEESRDGGPEAGFGGPGLLLYGRCAALLCGSSTSWAAALHSPHLDDAAELGLGAGGGPAAGNAVTAKRPPTAAGPPAARGGARAEVASPAALTDAAGAPVLPGGGWAGMDAVRAAWVHPLELWGSIDPDGNPLDAGGLPGGGGISSGWRTHQACCWALTGRLSPGRPALGVGKTLFGDGDDDGGGLAGGGGGGGGTGAGGAGGKVADKNTGKAGATAGVSGGARTRSARSARAEHEGGAGGFEQQRVAVSDLFRLPQLALVAGPSAQGHVLASLTSLGWERGVSPSFRGSPRLSFIVDGCYDDSLVEALVALGSPAQMSPTASPPAPIATPPVTPAAVFADSSGGAQLSDLQVYSPSGVGNDVTLAVQAYQGSLSFLICRSFLRHVVAAIAAPAPTTAQHQQTDHAEDAYAEVLFSSVVAMRAFCSDYLRGAAWQTCTTELACAASLSEGSLVALESLLHTSSDLVCPLEGFDEDLLLPTIAWLRDRWCTRKRLWSVSVVRRSRLLAADEAAALASIPPEAFLQTGCLPSGVVAIEIAPGGGTVVEEVPRGRDDPLLSAPQVAAQIAYGMTSVAELWHVLINGRHASSLVGGAGASVTPIHAAILCGAETSQARLSAYVEAGASVDLPATDGTTALMVALVSGQLGVADFLLERGARIDAADAHGQPVVKYAATSVDRSRMPHRSNGRNVPQEQTRSCIAAEGITALQSRAAFNADAEDGSGERLLHWLAGGSEMSSSCITVNGQPVMLKRMVSEFVAAPLVKNLVVSSGADVNARTHTGRTPLQVAFSAGRLMVARALLDAGADPTLADYSGCTALHVAAKCFNSNEDVTQALVKALAEPHSTEAVFFAALVASFGRSVANSEAVWSLTAALTEMLDVEGRSVLDVLLQGCAEGSTAARGALALARSCSALDECLSVGSQWEARSSSLGGPAERRDIGGSVRELRDILRWWEARSLEVIRRASTVFSDATMTGLGGEQVLIPASALPPNHWPLWQRCGLRGTLIKTELAGVIVELVCVERLG